MTPKKKQKSQTTTRKRKHGTWFTVGQIVVIFGAILAIVAGIIDIIYTIAASGDGGWSVSFTFGQIDIPYLGAILAIVMGFIILWLAVDRRVYNKMRLIPYAILVIVLALIGGNIGCLIVIIGGLIIIFYRLSKN